MRLVSIVAIDVVGFSTMSERDHKKAARQIEQLRARIERIAGAHEGRLFNTAGDGFMLEFNSAGSALGAIQELLDKRGRGEPQLRVGAHVGDVVVTATNDLLGHGVNVAARLQQLANPGTALVSAEFRSMAHSSPTAAFQSKGRQPLDNIEQKVQTFEILSKRQRMARLGNKVVWGAGFAAVAAALIYFAPTIYNFAKPYIPALQNNAAPTASAATSTTVAETPPAPTPAPVPVHVPQPGESFADCSACPQMVVLAGASYQMGSPSIEPGRVANEGPVHQVTVPTFAVSKTEVTYAQWDACVAGGGCGAFAVPDHGWGRDNRPVVGVSWNDAQAYVQWLNTQPGARNYRLLTEAEWEFAARAGSQQPYATNERFTGQMATWGARRTAAVGTHPANAFQLQDMLGNAPEWVEDCYAASYAQAPADGSAVNPATCARRVYRGGAFSDVVTGLRVAARKSGAPASRTALVGFRVARGLN